jgi:hypothetical protein
MALLLTNSVALSEDIDNIPRAVKLNIPVVEQKDLSLDFAKSAQTVSKLLIRYIMTNCL